MDALILDWLLEENNPAVRLRALTGLCSLPEDALQVKTSRALVMQTLAAGRDLARREPGESEGPVPLPSLSAETERIGLAQIYGLTALAEAGLRRQDVSIDLLVDRLLAQPFDAACGDMLVLRDLVMLGYEADPRLEHRFAQVSSAQLPDGGWLCLHRLKKMSEAPKSCIKVNMLALLLAAEMAKRGLSLASGEVLVQYFIRRRLFYRMDDPARLVLECRPGWRMTDVFYPIEVQRVGLPVLLEALAALGAGRAPELQEAWDLLESKRDAQGKVLLEGTLGKSYLPKERVGRPSKWATLYACMAWKKRN